MSGHAYTEDQLVDQPAIGLCAELRQRTASAVAAVPVLIVGKSAAQAGAVQKLRD